MEGFSISAFEGKKIVVTGGTGFIGGRLIELLSQELTTCSVHAIVRNYGTCIRIARYPVTIIQADILDKESCRMAFEGADYIFHCAYGNSGSRENRYQVDTLGTVNMLELAYEYGLSGFLFLSTVSVYGIHRNGIINEQSFHNKTFDEYAINKLKAERTVQSFGRETGLPVVILQPTGVYGPWSQSYGIRLARIFRTKSFVFETNFNGIANLIYIDDLIQAMLKAIISKKAQGNTYLINGFDFVEWKTFFSMFSEMMGTECFKILSPSEIKNLKRSKRKNATFVSILGRSVKVENSELRELKKYWVFGIVTKVLPFFRAKKTKGKSLLEPAKRTPQLNDKELVFLDKQAMDFYASTARISAEKAEKDFNFKPKYSFKVGFCTQIDWHKWFSGQNTKR